ncbi:hypothetical protein JTB14_028175 [Gonioctena quinquepunctata]|nr:hypothetical protein JTB14_028175 [Gonioctena quinquepunctata]
MEQLEVLRTYIIDIDKRAFGLTRMQCRRLVYDFAEGDGIPHRFNRQLEMAGEDWLFNFMKKNKLSLRKPEATSIGRLMAFNKVNVDAFFSTLREIRQKTPYEPHQIFNVNETGISTVPPKLSQSISPTGARRVSKIVSGERGKNVTAVCCMSATGKNISPFIIFSRKRMKPESIQGTTVGTFGFCSDSGWMTADLFHSYMQHFAKYASPSEVNPILLLLDNHASRINFCREKISLY